MATREVLREINLNLNTRERDASSALSLPTWTLSVPITPKHRQSFFEIMVRSISLPKSFFYSFVGIEVTWQETTSAGVPNHAPVVYTLPDGNYTIESLLNFIRTWYPYFSSNPPLVKLDDSTYTLSLTGKNNHWGVLTLSKNLADALSLPTTYAVASQTAVTSNGPVNNVLSRSLFILCHLGVTDCYSAILVPFRESRIICRVPMLHLASIAQGFDYDFPMPTTSCIVDQTLSSIQLSLATEQFAKLNVLLDYTITLSIFEVLKPDEAVEAPSIRMSDLLIGSSASSTDQHMGAPDEEILRDAAKVLKANRELQKEQS